MKVLVLILGSMTLIAGGVAMTSQQDTRSNLLTNQQIIQPEDTRLLGSDCQWVETPIFDTVAHPLINATGCTFGGMGATKIDLDGDGIPEGIGDNSMITYSADLLRDLPAKKVSYVANSNPPEIRSEIFISVNPKYLTYEEALRGTIQSAWVSGWLDVTNDGKPDAIVLTNDGENVSRWWYVENISEWPAACASDLNSDGTVEVNDLMQIISDWGPCE